MQLKNLLNLTGDKLYTLPLMVIYITDGCNSRCITCDIWKNPRRNMPMALARELASVSKTLGTRWVLLSGGEAMQHPEWMAIAQLFRQQGIRVMLLTNGLFIKRQAQEIIDSVDDLIVSLDGGNAETYHRIRGVDAFDLILGGMQTVSQSSVVVSTRTTVQKQNFRELSQIVQVALNHGAHHASFLAVDVSNEHAFGQRTLIETTSALSLDDVTELEGILHQMETDHADDFRTKRIAESPQKLRRILVDYFKAVHHEAEFVTPKCNAPHFSTVVEVDGTVRPCYFLPSFGRLKPEGDSLDVVINQPTAQELRKAYRTGQRTECATCVCPLYKSPRDLMRMS